MPSRRTDAGNNGRRDNLYKRGGTWYARFWHDGREYRTSTKTKSRAEAQLVLGRLREDAARGRLGLPKRSVVTVKEWAENHYLPWAEAHKESWQRDQLSLKHLGPTFGHLRLKEVTPSRVEAYMRERAKKVSGPTVNREVACLRKLLSHAVQGGELEKNPLLGFHLFPESPARVPVLEGKDMRALLAELAPWMRFLVRMAVATGARLGELCSLTWADVDFASGTLSIRDSKAGESRMVPLHREMFQELKDRRGLPGGFVVTVVRNPPEASSVSHAFKRAVRKIGRGDLRFHDLRHVAASRMLEAGASLPEVSAVLGHKTLAMSRRYAHPAWRRLRSLIDNIKLENGGDEEGDNRAIAESRTDI